jgi:hypothetical protein
MPYVTEGVKHGHGHSVRVCVALHEVRPAFLAVAGSCLAVTDINLTNSMWSTHHMCSSVESQFKLYDHAVVGVLCRLVHP